MDPTQTLFQKMSNLPLLWVSIRKQQKIQVLSWTHCTGNLKNHMLCEQKTPQKFHYGPSQCNWTLNSWRGHFYDFAKLAFYPLAADNWADHKPWSGTVEPHLTCPHSPTPQLNRLWREKAKESIEIIKQQNPNGLPAQCSVLNCSPPNRLRPAKTKETTGRETASQALTTITNQVSSSSVFFRKSSSGM